MDAIQNVFNTIKENDIRYIDFRFTDTRGVWHHITTTADQLDKDTFKTGMNFDGSSIDGWCAIHQSDMFFVPDAETAYLDPFMSRPTLTLTCDIIDAATGEPYGRDPRGIAKRAEAYLKSTGIADKALMGPELEFFVFDGVRFHSGMNESYYHIEADNGSWSSGSNKESGNTGHGAPAKGGYFKMPPTDRMHDMRTEILETLSDVGLQSLLHHSEVGTANQCEIGVGGNTPTRKADEVQTLKYIIRNIADTYGYTATFMPKPLAGDNGSGMHVHQSLWKGGKPLFAGNDYAGLSQTALYYVGGIIKHAKALNAFTNPLTNSYKRLIPGFEAPVMLAYASRNRSASIRIPASGSANSKRIETRFPDPGANPYLAFSAMMMAGLDGIQNEIDPGKAMEEDLYALPENRAKKVPQVCGSLQEALDCLKKDNAFLQQGGVFSQDMIDAYIELKMEDVHRLNHAPHPVEFSMYFGI